MRKVLYEALEMTEAEVKAFEEALVQGQRASQLREEHNLSDSEYLSILDGQPLTEVLAKRV